MAGDPVTNRYLRYKAGTQRVVGWLTSATQSLGCASLPDDTHETTKRDLSTNDLLRLAEIIAAHPKADIPLEIIVIAEDVIDGRQACADWYSAAKNGSGGEIETQNRTHRNFIDVLKRIVQALKSKYEAKLPKRLRQKPAKTAEMKTEILRNIYEYLDIEQPSAMPLGSRPSTAPTSKTKSPGTKGPQDTHIVETNIGEAADKAFALWCFFKDQYDLRKFIDEIWKEYIHGKLSFPTVCTVTDYAFMLMTNASNALTAQYPCFADMRMINNFLGFTLMTLGGGLTILAVSEKKVAADAQSDPTLHELFCVKATCMMQDTCDMVCRREDDVEVPKEAQNVSNMFTAALFSVDIELHLLAVYDAADSDVKRELPLVHRDTFLAGLVRLCRTMQLPPWLVTACQAYIQIYDILGFRHTDGYNKLHKDGAELKQTLTEHQQFMNSRSQHGIDRRPSTARIRGVPPVTLEFGLDFVLSALVEDIDTDGMQYLLEEIVMPEVKKEQLPAFRLQKTLPVTCGSLLLIGQRGAHAVGLLDCNSGFAMLAIAHLYKAARLCGALDEEWPDMEWFITQHSNQRPFVLESAKSGTPLTTHAKLYAIALGVKPSTNLAFKRHNRGDKATPTFQCADLPPMSISVKNGRLINAGSCSPYMQHMAELSKNRAHIIGDSAWSSLQELALHKVAEAVLEKGADSTGPRSTKVDHLQTRLTAVQLLGAFKDMLKEDELNLNFDRCRFMRDCSELLTNILDEFKLPGSGIDQQAYRWVNVMLWEAAATEKNIPSAPKLEDTMLYLSVSLFQKQISQQGSSELKAARMLCSGHHEASSTDEAKEPDMRALGDLMMRAAPVMPDAEALLQLMMLAMPNDAPDRRAVRGQKPYLGIGSKVFQDLGDALQEELGIVCHMDPSTNIMSLYYPEGKERKVMQAFLDDLWGGKVCAFGDGNAKFISSCGKDAIGRNGQKMSKRQTAARELVNALANVLEQELLPVVELFNRRQ